MISIIDKNITFCLSVSVYGDGGVVKHTILNFHNVIYFYCRIHKHYVITEGLGTVSSTVLFGLSASPYGYVHF